VKHFAGAAEPAWEPSEGPQVGRVPARALRLCAICHQPLAAGARKVHPDLCAHKRKMQVQRLRRWRRRRWPAVE
jgi:mono/diheme cytochrome c family protein